MQGYNIKIQKQSGRIYEFQTLQTIKQFTSSLLIDSFSQDEVDKAEITELSEAEAKELQDKIEKEIDNW